ncbi:MAG: nitroreductase family protein [Eubacteriales bacterium]
MFENQELTDIILRRKSTRTFLNKKLTDDQIWQIKSFIYNIDNRKGIFGNVRFELIENKSDNVFGAYGDIVGAPYYLAAVAQNNKNALLDAGFAFERVILYAESIGMGTCWLAATSFDRNEAELRVELQEGELIAAIAPIGEKAERTQAELNERKKLKSDTRLDFDELFADAATGGKIEDEATKKILELVRIAPSALNNQPWRVVIDQDTAHFYVIRKFHVPLKYDVQMLDMGAAVYHYCNASKKYNCFQQNFHSKKNLEYVVSVK